MIPAALAVSTAVWRELVILFVAIQLTFLLSRTTCNVFFHPLRKYPGPWYFAASRLPLTIAVLRGKAVYLRKALYAKYGPVVRVAPGELSYSDERVWSGICGSTPHSKRGMARHDSLFDLVGGEMMRKAFAPAVTTKALVPQQDLIVSHIDALVHKLVTMTSQPVDMVDMLRFAAYNLFSEMFLGESMGLLDDTKYVDWVHSFPGFARATTIVAELQHYTITRILLRFVIQKFGKKHRELFIGVTQEHFDRRLAKKNTGGSDILAFAMDPKRQLTVGELREFAPFIMMAGGETTPTLETGLIYLLMTHIPALEKLKAEIRGRFASDEDITMEALARLPYLNACIDEAFRIHPPVATGLGRVVPHGGAEVAGRWVPGGTIVTVVHHSTFHSGINFHKPDAFIPERWLPENDHEFGNDIKSSLHPFSIGPQACFGQDLARQVIRLNIGKLLLHFEMKLDKASEGWMENQQCFVGWIQPPLMAELSVTQKG
ncbi:cytochrome P450 [Periconia macrospinosa]|uniref:Cytochrome P450 n=1 Tax=Periconia macrospinosa TaxID=97972 RepID=A0A2V1CZT3_9PLEO|nr:cytochrome P450 [Periconia macrospinosa]